MAAPASLFKHLTVAPPDPILGTTLAWRADKHPKKMNLGVGAYRTEEGKPYVFEVVRKVEREIVNDPALDKEYLAIDGLPDFNRVTQRLILGENARSVVEGRAVTVQCLSGTGSLRVGAEFIKRFMAGKKVAISKPTWGNHLNIFTDAGVSFVEYPYFDNATLRLDYAGMTSCLSSLPAGSVVLLHACAHNPTGVDPTEEQWRAIAQLMKERALVPYFDCAYQGFASGDLVKDSFAVRLFESLGFEMFISQSYAKNFGLYAERIGALTVVCSEKSTAEAVLSQLKVVIRPMYSSPPVHGARIVARVLSNPALFAEWQTELTAVSGRIQRMRQLLLDALRRRNTPGDWTHITSQIGMFSYTGLSPAQCDVLIKKYHIYLLRNGRVSMAGINGSNVEYLAEAIHDAVTSGTSKL